MQNQTKLKQYVVNHDVEYKSVYKIKINKDCREFTWTVLSYQIVHGNTLDVKEIENPYEQRVTG